MLTASYGYPSTKRVEGKEDMITMVDYTNLYIKNLDSNVTSNDLFSLFRDFGEIISARVMRDTLSGLSKGYGFVSFKHAEDAHEAIMRCNGLLFHSKTISVNYHEHKKTVQQYQKMQHHPAPRAIPHYEPKPSHVKMTEYVPHSPAMMLYPGESTAAEPEEPTLGQRERLQEAIEPCLLPHQKKDLPDLVYLLGSLKKRELSLCLFNVSFLKQQIEEAYKVMHLFDQKPTSIATTPSLDHRQLDDDNDSSPSVAAILHSLEGMTLNKKKRVFGDVFFPYVKATGIRRSPKVTIRLLDTVPLDDLAFHMYDKKELTKRALVAYTDLYGEHSNPFRDH
ncbi:hypothetical protein BY458DRAFT_507234 [Sporodiniella umbellata]|nr:hypothetical protein BY458DRAFT_507234 [Sporodiniella umbellata]